MNEDHPYKTTGSKIVYQNPWIRVREDKIIRSDGDEDIYGVMESNDSVMVVVLNEMKEIYLIRAYSYPAQSWNWELPGGGGDKEDALVASKRELIEETGITAEEWTLLAKTRVCNGLMTERQSTYLACNLTMTSHRALEDKAIVNMGTFYSLSKIHEMIQAGALNDNQSLTGIYLAEQLLSREQF